MRTNGTFDYERQRNYTLIIEARDFGTPSQAATVEMVIIIIDVNDNPPVLRNQTLVVGVNRDVALGVPLAQFQADDADSGVNGEVFYDVVQETYVDSYPITLVLSVDVYAQVISARDGQHLQLRFSP